MLYTHVNIIFNFLLGLFILSFSFVFTYFILVVYLLKLKTPGVFFFFKSVLQFYFIIVTSLFGSSLVVLYVSFFKNFNFKLTILITLIIISTVFIVSMFYYRTIIFVLLKLSRTIRPFYWELRKNTQFLINGYRLTVIKIVDISISLYRNHLDYLLLGLLSFSVLIQNYFYFIVFCLYLAHNALINLDYFNQFRKEREKDIETYQYHWSTDSDLIFLNKILILLKYFGIFILVFSYLFKLAPLDFANSTYKLHCTWELMTLRKLQLYLGLNLVGPKILFSCFVFRILLGLHVIFFRNPKTRHKYYAASTLMKEFARSYAAGGAVVGGGMAAFAEYRLGGVDSIIKKTVDYQFAGVVRLNEQQEREFNFLMDKKLKIPRCEMREDDETRIFSKPKVKRALALPQYSEELAKFSPKELNELDMVELIPEEDILRFNLANYERVCAKKGSISYYIYSFSGDEKSDVLSGVKNTPTSLEQHRTLQHFIKSVHSTPGGQKLYNDFVEGKSNDLLDSWKFGKSSWN